MISYVGTVVSDQRVERDINTYGGFCLTWHLLTNMFILAKHHSFQTQTVKSVKDFRTNLAQSLIGD